MHVNILLKKEDGGLLTEAAGFAKQSEGNKDDILTVAQTVASYIRWKDSNGDG